MRRNDGFGCLCEFFSNLLELSLHFFCQIKTGKSFSSSSIKDEEFTYWANQPVPVFSIELKYNDQNKMHEENEIWIHDIPYILTKRDAQVSHKKEPPRRVDEKFLICEESNDKDKMQLKDFIYHHVPWSYGLWQMRRFGLVYPNPEIIEQRFQVFVGGFTYLYKEKISETLDYANKVIAWDKMRNDK